MKKSLCLISDRFVIRKIANAFRPKREGSIRDVIVHARIRNATRVDYGKIKFSDREGIQEGGKRIKGDRKGVSAQKPPLRDSEGDVERARRSREGRTSAGRGGG